MITQVRR